MIILISLAFTNMQNVILLYSLTVTMLGIVARGRPGGGAGRRRANPNAPVAGLFLFLLTFYLEIVYSNRYFSNCRG